jgi:hypothetical protein
MDVDIFENSVVWMDCDFSPKKAEITQDQIDFYFLLLNYFIENWKKIKPIKMGGFFLIPMIDIERCIG